jgi:hypothetical protein
VGYWKNKQIEDQERGVDSSQTGFSVCQNCFSNPGLRKFIAENAFEQDGPDNLITCGFCDPADASPIVADFDSVCGHVVQCIRHRYNAPEEELPYESAEGGYQGVCLSTKEVLADIAELETPHSPDGRLLEALTSAILGDSWCQRGYFGLSPEAAIHTAWDEFQDVSRTGTVLSFVYGRTIAGREFMTPLEFLDWLGVKCLTSGFVKEIQACASIVRVRRQEPGQSYRSARELGPPPADRAKANRLSPEGTVMMYAAEDLETALAETATEPGTYAVGEFQLIRDIHVLDLVDLPEPVCFFDLTDADARDVIGFLRSFATDVSKPVKPAADAHLEYIPTQIVTEHFRRRVRAGEEPLDGIRYRSAKCSEGVCVGLFADHLSVCEPEGQEKGMGIIGPGSWIRLMKAWEVTWP